MTWCSIVLDGLGAVEEIAVDGAEQEAVRERVESRVESGACDRE